MKLTLEQFKSMYIRDRAIKKKGQVEADSYGFARSYRIAKRCRGCK